MENTKKGGIAFEWIYMLAFLFFIGIIYIIFNQVNSNYVYPIAEDLVPDDFANKSYIIEENDKIMSFWSMIPIVVFILFLLFIFIRSTINDPSGET